jgi:hypothetical protein
MIGFGEQISHFSRWEESVQVSEALLRALKDEVMGSGAGGLDLNFYVGVVPKVPGLGWVLKLSVWRREHVDTGDPLATSQSDVGGGWDFGIGADGKLIRKDGVEIPTIFNRERVIGAYMGADLWAACEREFKEWLVFLRDLIGKERAVASSKLLLGR